MKLNQDYVRGGEIEFSHFTTLVLSTDTLQSCQEEEFVGTSEVLEAFIFREDVTDELVVYPNMTWSIWSGRPLSQPQLKESFSNSNDGSSNGNLLASGMISSGNRALLFHRLERISSDECASFQLHVPDEPWSVSTSTGWPLDYYEQVAYRLIMNSCVAYGRSSSVFGRKYALDPKEDLFTATEYAGLACLGTAEPCQRSKGETAVMVD